MTGTDIDTSNNSGVFRLSIPSDHLAEMIDHVRAWYPMEGCGLLATQGDQVTRVYPGTNVARSETFYEMDPREVLHAMQDIDERGERLGAIFHSHPSTQAWPSPTDLELIFDPSVYMIIISLAGIFAFFADATFNEFFGINIGWGWYALGMIVVISMLTYFDVKLSVWVLGVALITEVLILLLMDFGVLFSGGGPDGLSARPLAPAEGFTSVAGGVAAVGIFMAFWSWVGFEATVNYGEESKNPKKIVPRATYLSVVGLGIFYTFTSWMVIAGQKGPQK
jgi:proteasome lid subunit RPN8/RPN11